MSSSNNLEAYEELSRLELARDGLPPYREIRKEVHEALNSIALPADVLLDMYDKLAKYKVCKGEPEEGKYVRWVDLIKMQNGKVELARGGHVCGYRDTKDGKGILCRRLPGTVYTQPIYNTLMFQMLTADEYLVAQALDYLHRN